MVGREKADIADTLHLKDVAMANTLAFYMWGAQWRHLVNTTEPSMRGGDAALCQITLTTCCHACHRSAYRSQLLLLSLLITLAMQELLSVISEGSGQNCMQPVKDTGYYKRLLEWFASLS